MQQSIDNIIVRAASGQRLGSAESLALADIDPDADTDAGAMDALTAAARQLRDAAYPYAITYSTKVFIPLTQLCRDVCHYCTFAQPPRKDKNGKNAPAYMRLAEALSIAEAGRAAGCHEALFTLGDKPELRYRAAREELAALGHASTLSYLAEIAQQVMDKTGLLPHLNPGVVSVDEARDLKRVSASQGLMLESSSARLTVRGGPHYRSPDKQPAVRLASIAAAGAARVPLTSGLLIGIGETRRERIESLLVLRDLHDKHGHIQELIIQNFKAKSGTRMRNAAEPTLAELIWTIAVARLIFGAQMSIQAPPNLSQDALPALIDAGINDWGGLSPVTPDYVNPEAAWPQLETIKQATEGADKRLTPRLPLHPSYLKDHAVWLDEKVYRLLLQHSDAQGYARSDSWHPGGHEAVPPLLPAAGDAPENGTWSSASAASPPPFINAQLRALIDQAIKGIRLDERQLAMLFSARGHDLRYLCAAADALRKEQCGDTVTYVVNRNINYTNICYFGCGFCAFSKGRVAERLRERGYNISLDEIQQRVTEAWERGATEVCLQGGIHPDYRGETYLNIARAVKQAQPAIHLHAFSPLEITHGAATAGLSVDAFLHELKAAGLDTLPGTAAEILDDEIRQIICADKLNTQAWLAVMRSAHRQGLTSTATIMFGHVDSPINWARHLLRIRDLQAESGGFSEFVPLPYVHMEAPLHKKGRSRPGPTFRETMLMHAVARLALHPLIGNIQASWVKLGEAGALQALRAGVNDLGGTLMNESISRAAGAAHGQELNAAAMQALIRKAGRLPQQRTTRYQPYSPASHPAHPSASHSAYDPAAVLEAVNHP